MAVTVMCFLPLCLWSTVCSVIAPVATALLLPPPMLPSLRGQSLLHAAVTVIAVCVGDATGPITAVINELAVMLPSRLIFELETHKPNYTESCSDFFVCASRNALPTEARAFPSASQTNISEHSHKFPLPPL